MGKGGREGIKEGEGNGRKGKERMEKGKGKRKNGDISSSF